MRVGIAVRSTDDGDRRIFGERCSNRVRSARPLIPAHAWLEATAHLRLGESIDSERRQGNSLGVGENERAAATVELLGADFQEVLALRKQRCCARSPFSGGRIDIDLACEQVVGGRTQPSNARPPRNHWVVGPIDSSVFELMPELVSRISQGQHADGLARERRYTSRGETTNEASYGVEQRT